MGSFGYDINMSTFCRRALFWEEVLAKQNATATVPLKDTVLYVLPASC